MDLERKERRRNYWRKKYEDPEWGHDIHFALFPTQQINRIGFLSGLKINTTQTSQNLQELASLYRLAKGVRILDYGCGSGDLLIEFAATLPNVQAIGIDIAETAIAYAKEHVNPEAGSLEFLVGDIETLKEQSGPFDIIVCRDMYYTLDSGEQEVLLRTCADLLGPGGVFYVADLAIEANSVDSVRIPLLDRQYAGEPIKWSVDSSNKQLWSITSQAETVGFELFREEIESSAVADSYAAACDLADATTKTAFESLARLARRKIKSHPCVPYIRLFFSRPESCHTWESESIGVRVEQPLNLGGKMLLRRGDWSLPISEWSLVLGRSGVGKTTLLNILSGYVQVKGVERIGKVDATKFLLDQRPVLIEEMTVDDNILLFARSHKDAEVVMEALGFDHSLRSRKANADLSGGEWQRVALGQAIAARPEIIFLDEPGTGIDRVRKYQFFSTIRKTLSQMTNGKPTTVICVDHEFIQIEEFFTYIFEMLHGRLVCLKG